jgi:hypothetical protein
MSGAGVRVGAVSSTVVWLLVVVSWGSSLELPVGGAGRGADGWAAGLGSGLSIPARATSTSSTTVHSKSSGWSMVWAELDDGGTCGQTGVVVSCAVGAVGEGGGPADVFPGLGGAHLVRSGGVWGAVTAYQSGARLGGRLTVGQTWYSPGGVRGPVTGPRPEVSPRTGHTDERVSRCGSA